MPLFRTNSGVTAPLTLASGTITADAPVLDLSQTWNNGAVTFTGLKLNVTDTASVATSLLFDFQQNGITKIRALSNGNLYCGNIVILSDVVLLRDAANTLALRNSTSAQTFNLYGTYTDASNYRRIRSTMTTGGAATIAAEGLGTGATGNSLVFSIDGATALSLSSSGAGAFAGTITSTGGGLTINTTSSIRISSKFSLYSSSDGHYTFGNFALTDADIFLKLGVNTSAACGIKRVGTEMRVRLNDDSAYTFITGKLRTDTNYAAGTFTATGYLTVYDLAGTAYRIPCAV